MRFWRHFGKLMSGVYLVLLIPAAGQAAHPAASSSEMAALRQIAASLREKKLPQARSQIAALIATHPRQERLRFTLGLLLAREQDFRDAARQFTAALRLRPSYDAWYNLGLCDSQLQRWRQAHDAYFQALDLRPQAFDPNLRLGMGYLNQHRAWRAIPWLYKSVGEQPQNQQALFLLGEALLKQHFYNSAVRILERLVAIQPKNARAITLLGTTYASSAKYAKALAEFQRATRLAPNAPNLYVSEAEMETTLDQDAAALRDFHRALKLRPGYALAWSELGRLELRLGQYARAETSLRRALRLQPGDSEPAFNLAKVLISRRDFKGALRLIVPLTTAQPRRASYWYLQSRALEGLGRSHQAAVALTRFSRLRSLTTGKATLLHPADYIH